MWYEITTEEQKRSKPISASFLFLSGRLLPLIIQNSGQLIQITWVQSIYQDFFAKKSRNRCSNSQHPQAKCPKTLQKTTNNKFCTTKILQSRQLDNNDIFFFYVNTYCNDF